MSRIIFINRFFYPDHSATSQMLSDIAFGLAKRGYAITIITSRQLYEDASRRLPTHETIDGVTVRRIWTSRFGRNVVVLRALDYISFYLSAAWALLMMARHGDTVVAKTDPPLLSLVAAPIARLRGARYVNWLQDVFPEVAQVVYGKSGKWNWVYALLARLRNASLRAAYRNVAIGSVMAERVKALCGTKSAVDIIPNFADGAGIRPVAPEQNSLRTAWGMEGHFVVAYSGNLGRAHEYGTILDAIRITERDDPTIRWLFIGSGALFAEFRAAAEQQGLRSVSFQPYQPREKLAESLSVGDVHLISLRPDLEGLIVPSKFYGILAAGRPAIFIGARDGEIAQWSTRCDCGLVVDPGDGAGLAKVVAQLSADPRRCRAMGDNGRRTFDAEFSLDKAIENWAVLLGPPGPPAISVAQKVDALSA